MTPIGSLLNNFILNLRTLYICINLFKNLSIFWFDFFNLIEQFFHTFPISMFQNGIQFLFAFSICCFDMISKFIIYLFFFCLINLLFQNFKFFFNLMLKNEIQIFISFLNLLLQNESQIIFCLFSLLLLTKFKYFCLFDKMRFNILFGSINYFKMKPFFLLLF